MRRLLPRFAAVILAAGVVMALAAGAFAVPLRHARRTPAPASPSRSRWARWPSARSCTPRTAPCWPRSRTRRTASPSRSPRSPRTWSTPSWRSRTPTSGSTTATTCAACCAPSAPTSTPGGISQGGSTITQQLVKLPARERADPRPQGPGGRAAQRLEQQMSKDEILDRYLNTVYFGNHAYGVQAAAETYFGVGVAAARHRPGGAARRHHPQPDRLRPGALSRAGGRAARRGARPHGRRRVADRGRRRPCWHAAPTVPSFHEVLPTAQRLLPVRGQAAAPQRPAVRHPRRRPSAERYHAVFQGGLRDLHDLRPGRPGPGRSRPRRDCRCDNGVFAQSGVEPGDGRAQPGLGRDGVGRAGDRRRAHDGRRARASTTTSTTSPPRTPGASGRRSRRSCSRRSWSRATRPTTSSTASAPCTFAERRGEPYEVEQLRRRRRQRGHDHRRRRWRSSNCAFVRLGLHRRHAERRRDGPPPRHPRDRRDVDGDGEADATICATARRRRSAPRDHAARDGLGLRHHRQRRRLQPALPDRAHRGPQRQRHLRAHSRRPSSASRPRRPGWSRACSQQNVQSGTGTRAQISGQPAAGKTGTNQDSTRRLVRRLHARRCPLPCGSAASAGTTRSASAAPASPGGRYPAAIWGDFMRALAAGAPARADFAGPPSRPGTQTLTVPGGVDLTPAPPRRRRSRRPPTPGRDPCRRASPAPADADRVGDTAQAIADALGGPAAGVTAFDGRCGLTAAFPRAEGRVAG